MELAAYPALPRDDVLRIFGYALSATFWQSFTPWEQSRKGKTDKDENRFNFARKLLSAIVRSPAFPKDVRRDFLSVSLEDLDRLLSDSALVYLPAHVGCVYELSSVVACAALAEPAELGDVDACFRNWSSARCENMPRYRWALDPICACLRLPEPPPASEAWAVEAFVTGSESWANSVGQIFGAGHTDPGRRVARMTFEALVKARKRATVRGEALQAHYAATLFSYNSLKPSEIAEVREWVGAVSRNSEPLKLFEHVERSREFLLELAGLVPAAREHILKNPNCPDELKALDALRAKSTINQIILPDGSAMSLSDWTDHPLHTKR